jgi:hypothetical protein
VDHVLRKGVEAIHEDRVKWALKLRENVNRVSNMAHSASLVQQPLAVAQSDNRWLNLDDMDLRRGAQRLSQKASESVGSEAEDACGLQHTPWR